MSDIPDLPISPADLGGPAADLKSVGAPAEPDMRTSAGLDAAPEASTAVGVDTEAAIEPATATRQGATPGPASDHAPKAAREMSPGACAELLKQHFPALFGGQPKPLKLRIQADIAQRAPGVFSKGAMSAFFRRYTGSTGYLIALGKASQRFDLDGQPAGDLSEEHRQLAREELTRRRQMTREREQQAQAQQQAQQAELQQARQTRLALLRDFERTTLTPANFCALKGLTAETLEPLLAQARREAAEAPPPRAWQPDERRGPHVDDRDGRRSPRPPRPDHRPAVASGRPDNRSERRPDIRPEIRPDSSSDPRQDARPDMPPDARPGAQAVARPEAGAGARPAARPSARSDVRPGDRPDGQPGARKPNHAKAR